MEAKISDTSRPPASAPENGASPNKPRSSPPGPLRLALLSLLFLASVIFTVVYHETFFIPIFLGLLTLFKTLFKSVTPKLIVLLLKNSLIIKLRQFITRGSTHLLVLSHRPARLKLRAFKQKIADYFVGLFRRYMLSPLWLRTSIALGLLLLTASSSYVFIALLIIPQPLLNWVKKLLAKTLNKLGITQALNAIWRFFVPARLQRKWNIYQKWTLGRRQILTARRLHTKLAEVPMQRSPMTDKVKDTVDYNDSSTG